MMRTREQQRSRWRAARVWFSAIPRAQRSATAARFNRGSQCLRDEPKQDRASLRERHQASRQRNTSPSLPFKMEERAGERKRSRSFEAVSSSPSRAWPPCAQDFSHERNGDTPVARAGSRRQEFRLSGSLDRFLKTWPPLAGAQPASLIRLRKTFWVLAVRNPSVS